MKKSLKKVIEKFALPKVGARHQEMSAIYSADDEVFHPSERLLRLSEQVIPIARQLDFSDVRNRVAQGDGRLLDVWPGEHYRLLGALVQVLRPATIIEIGTARGMSALSMMNQMPEGSRLYTFDIVPWNQYDPTSYLSASDFEKGRIVQYTDDLSDQTGFFKHKELLASADLIFVDAAKDGYQEQRFIDNFSSIRLKQDVLVVFDDIRLVNMLRIWRELKRPKLDITSFGHWSGTGLVDWNAG
jgi:predicted O-methyltransferase YrrM